MAEQGNIQLVSIQEAARDLCQQCSRREGENCNVACRVSGENKCCGYCDKLTGICYCEYLRQARHFKERDYFRRVERFLYDIAPTKVALEDLGMELREIINTPKIAGVTDGIRVSGGRSISKPEKYAVRVEYLKAEIYKREKKIKRFNMVMAQVGKSERGNELKNLVKWKYIDGYDNEAVWRMMNIERATFYRRRLELIDIVFKCLPTQFLEEYVS